MKYHGTIRQMSKIDFQTDTLTEYVWREEVWALFRLFSEFKDELKTKTLNKFKIDGYTGWDSKEFFENVYEHQKFTIETKSEATTALLNAIENKNWLNVAVLAMFLWNNEQEGDT
jgi:hypothetical protein